MTNFTLEMIEKAKTAKSAEELLAMAKKNGIEMTEEDAKKYYGLLHTTRELADDELDNIAGGACDTDVNLPDWPTTRPVGLF